MNKRNHHFIPSFYLKNFIDVESMDSRDPYLWVFTKGDHVSKKRSPKNCAAITGFYDLYLLDKSISLDLENNLSVLESKAAKVFRKIRNKLELSNEDRVIFSEFVCATQMRTPFMRNSINKTIREMDLMALRLFAQSPDRIRETLDSISDGNKPTTDEDVKRFRNIIASQDFDLKIPSIISIRNLIDSVTELTKIILKMKWSFLEAPDKHYFITSDNPVVIKDPYNSSQFYGDGYFSSKNIELTFPLSSELCFYANWNIGQNDFHKVSLDNLFTINDRICNYSDKYIFSSKQLELNTFENRLYFKN